MIKKLIPKSLKGLGRELIRKAGYDVVYHSCEPGSFYRYPYAHQSDFFQDIKARGYQPDLAIDIGANHGSWSLDLSSTFPEVQSILVEPLEELSPHLESICNGKNGWRVAPVGIGGNEEIRRFQACEDTVSSSFLKGGEDGDGEVRELQIITLGTLLKDYANSKQPSLIKIDAEGLELEIINSGRDIIAAADVVMLEASFFEFNEGQPKFAELVAVMDQLDFSIYDFTMFYRRPHDKALGLMDCVFASNNSSLRNSHAW